jgi:hypothetical protein
MDQKRWSARRGVSSLGLAHVLGVLACGQAEVGATPEEVHGNLQTEGTNAQALSSGADCAELLERLQDDLLQQVTERAEQARQGADYYYGGGVFIDDVAPAPEAQAAPLSAGADVAVGGGFSETTVQVPGVDEGDFVKAEGDRIYLLHGTSLFVLNAWPANSTEVLGSIAIEGEPADLFVRDGKVVVLSRFYGPLPGQETNSPYYYYYPSYAKLTLLDAASGTPQVLRESYVEGNYGSSRRHDGVVRAIIQQGSKAQLDYPNVSYVDIFGHPRSQAEIDVQVDLWQLLSIDSIEDSVIEDYLPSSFERVGGELVRQPLRCADYWLPAPGLTQAGISSVVALDLDSPGEPLHSVSVLGYAERVYSNAEALVLTQTDYGYYSGLATQVETTLHRFDLEGADATYTASGTISGYIQSQYSLDELDGVIRVSTTEQSLVATPLEGDAGSTFQGPVSRVLTLTTAGNDLVELGRSPDFGASEQIYATRFFGDRAYVVTFRQVDPLFVVDLADPSAPTLSGQLHTPGFSNFLFPLPDHHLLGIGQDADENGRVQGLGLSIFDVRDPAAPSVAHKFVYEGQGFSDANIDARALSFHPEGGVISFPLTSYVTGENTLEVFRVSNSYGFTRLGGIHPEVVEPTLTECLAFLGYPQDPEFREQLEQDPAAVESLLSQCRYYYQPYERRGLFRGENVFAISSAGVDAYALDALEGPALGGADLPAYGYYGYYGPVAVDAPVASPPAEGAPSEAPVPSAPEGEEPAPAP